MRLATIYHNGGTSAARIDGDRVSLLDAPDVGSLLASESWRHRNDSTLMPAGHVTEVRFAPVIPNPEKIICVGFNYAAHMRELDMEPPKFPTLFAKFTRALVGANESIVLPRISEQVDWEAELAVVVGREIRYADSKSARAAIAGYTVANDVSVRDWQARTRQALQGKTWERTTPLGPWLVTADEFTDPLDLQLRCYVDNEVMQDATTADMHFSPAELVSYASAFITLVPGDVILTGSPSGAGFARQPPRFLKPGTRLITEIEGIGRLENECIREASVS